MSRQKRPAPFKSRLPADDPRREPDTDIQTPRPPEPEPGRPALVLPEGQYLDSVSGRRFRVVRAATVARTASVRWYTRGATGVIRAGAEGPVFLPARDADPAAAADAERFFRSQLAG